jgi:hypothetical protein
VVGGSVDGVLGGSGVVLGGSDVVVVSVVESGLLLVGAAVAAGVLGAAGVLLGVGVRLAVLLGTLVCTAATDDDA